MATPYDYAGIIHFHSELSFDGRETLASILEAAGQNGIDFLMLTDHGHLRARDAGFEGWHGGTLLIVGQEITPGQLHHYLAFGIEEAISGKGCSPQQVIDQVREQGGLGFIAHPDHEGTKMFHVKPYPWIDWNVAGYTGIGIWDFMTDWQSSLRTFYSRALLSYLFPALFLKGPREITLKRWDDLNRASRVVGIGELDNHDTEKTIFGVKIRAFPFQKAFRFIRTHLLTEDPLEKDGEKDKKALLSALQRGRAYVAQEYFRLSKGFSFVVREGNREALMGDDFELKGEGLLAVRLPSAGLIRVIKNGTLLQERFSQTLQCPVTSKGVYRIEVYQRVFGVCRPWIFSNPVYVV